LRQGEEARATLQAMSRLTVLGAVLGAVQGHLTEITKSYWTGWETQKGNKYLSHSRHQGTSFTASQARYEIRDQSNQCTSTLLVGIYYMILHTWCLL
jgi:hypothetical protein